MDWKPARSPGASRAKILATIGPASRDPEIVAEMIQAGVDAVRINASHVEPEEVAGWVRRVRRGSRAAGREVAVLLDLQGIKWRIGDLPEPLVLEEGREVLLASRRGAGRIPVSMSRIGRHLRPGADVFLQDGFLRLEVLRRRADGVLCRVVRGGTLKSRAGINIPGAPVRVQIPTRRDRAHIEAGLRAGVDLLALSFVRDARDLARCRRHARGLPLVAKIELPESVAAIDAIAAAADGILVARGDLAVEMKPEELPVLQKSLLAASKRARRPVIVATEMLASMVSKPRPTRAELTDVGNAVLDGADAVMLSDETAIGIDPVRVVRYMARIVATVERSLLAYDLHLPPPPGAAATRPDWAVADAAVEIAAQVGARAILAITGSGRTARLISANRPSMPLFSVAPDPAVRRRVALMWGVDARTVRPIRDPEKLLAHVLGGLRNSGHLERGDRVVVAYGSPLWGEGTKTNTVRIETVP